MSSLKTIRRRISSVKSTKQITRAMKLVSAAKLRRAQEAATNGRAYSDQLQVVMSRIVNGLPEGFSHPLLSERDEVKKRRIVVISGERGLCGAYNTNVIKFIERERASFAGETEILVIGRRGVSSSKRLGWNVSGEYEGLPEDANQWPIDEIAEQCMKDFQAGDVDEVVLCFTKFVSTMTQEVAAEKLIPLGEISSGTAAEEDADFETKYDPGPEEILVELIPLLVSTRLRQAALESKASEHAARMTAMDSATSNADDLIGSLKLSYNRARQSAITKELLDIVGGAEAIK